MTEKGRLKLKVLPQEWPQTRADCEPWSGDEHLRFLSTGESERCWGFRPCPLVSCKHHLWTDQGDYQKRRANGVLAAPEHIDPAEMQHTCVLDLADVGPMTFEAIAEVLGGVSRAAVEASALKGLNRARAAAKRETVRRQRRKQAV